MTSTPALSPPRRTPLALRLLAAVVAAAAGSIVVNSVIAAIAHGLGADDDFRPLQLPVFASLTVIGVLAGAIGWSLIRARAADPAALLRKLVPIVLALSFIPDIGVGISKSQPGTSWGAVLALMVMHVAVAAIAVTSYRILLPLDERVSR